VARDAPRLVCRTCVERGGVIGFEYKSRARLGTWPLVHIVLGMDPVTLRPRVARGVIAVGNVAVGVVAVAGLSIGLFTVGGLSIGALGAFGGLALGLGVSVGGLAVGSVAVGGAAVGFQYAVGGGALGRAVIDGMRCDHAARDFFAGWIGSRFLPPSCR
jgi:hypothetical protein